MSELLKLLAVLVAGFAIGCIGALIEDRFIYRRRPSRDDAE